MNEVTLYGSPLVRRLDMPVAVRVLDFEKPLQRSLELRRSQIFGAQFNPEKEILASGNQNKKTVLLLVCLNCVVSFRDRV